MAITSVRDADSHSHGSRSRANSPTRYELPEVGRRRNSGRYRFSRLYTGQVHGASQEIKLTHYSRPSIRPFGRAISLRILVSTTSAVTFCLVSNTNLARIILQVQCTE